MDFTYFRMNEIRENWKNENKADFPYVFFLLFKCRNLFILFYQSSLASPPLLALEGWKSVLKKGGEKSENSHTWDSSFLKFENTEKKNKCEQFNF